MTDTSFRFGEVHVLADVVRPAEDRVQFKSIFSTDNGGISILAFQKGQKLDEHVAPAEVMVSVLEGSVEFTIAGSAKVLNRGEFLLLGQGVPHSVVARGDAKIMLVKIKA